LPCRLRRMNEYGTRAFALAQSVDRRQLAFWYGLTNS
jgi:hypothetical protein